MTGSRVVALGHYQPERVLTNDELATMVETNDEWIQSRVGIRERRIAAPDEQVDEMAWRAADKAVANAGIDSSEIDYVVVATCTAIDRSPNIAARVAQRLGLGHPAAIDLNTACSGFSLRAGDRRPGHPGRCRFEGSCHRRGEAERLDGLDRPHHLRADRRRRRRGRGGRE